MARAASPGKSSHTGKGATTKDYFHGTVLKGKTRSANGIKKPADIYSPTDYSFKGGVKHGGGSKAVPKAAKKTNANATKAKAPAKKDKDSKGPQEESFYQKNSPCKWRSEVLTKKAGLWQEVVAQEVTT